MSVTPYPTLRLKLTMPQALKLQFLPNIPGADVSNKVNRTGDAMTGFLTLHADPIDVLGAATKQYVDAQIAGGGLPDAPSDSKFYGRFNATWADLGMVYQPLDADLTALAGQASTNALIYRIGSGSWGPVTIGSGLSFSGGSLSATGAGVTDGDKGDITVSGGGVTWTIDPDTVTDAKLANMTAPAFKARSTTGTGDPENVTPTQATAMLDVFTSTLKGLTPLSGGGTTNFLRADGTWATPPGGGVTDGDKGDITVSGGGAVWTIDLNAVTYAKLQDASATQRILARKTAGAGDYEESTLSEVLDFVGTVAQGDILYRGAATWAKLAAGTSGQVLQTQGAGANPLWVTAAGGGNVSASGTPINGQIATWTDATHIQGVTELPTANVQKGGLVELSRTVVSVAASTVAITTGIDATYDEYELHYYGVIASATVALILQISQDGGSTWKAGASDYQYSFHQSPTTAANASDVGVTAGAAIQLGNAITGANANFLSNGVIRFWTPANTTSRKAFIYDGMGIHPTNGTFRHSGQGYYNPDSLAFNALRFGLNAAGNYTAGTFVLYGRKK